VLVWQRVDNLPLAWVVEDGDPFSTVYFDELLKFKDVNPRCAIGFNILQKALLSSCFVYQFGVHMERRSFLL
jgi:hypothetical protein